MVTQNDIDKLLQNSKAGTERYNQVKKRLARIQAKHAPEQLQQNFRRMQRLFQQRPGDKAPDYSIIMLL
jgi:cell fate (sporulation/competence/biofilm development) regulator YlbF (YheA/YmcA/DUF963 family)